MIREVVIVEGKHDTEAVKRAVGADTIETGGSAVSPEVIRKVALAQVRRGVIIFTDPDVAGERIRRILSEAVPGCRHAFLPRESCLQLGEQKVHPGAGARKKGYAMESPASCGQNSGRSTQANGAMRVGVEHASDEAIRMALEEAVTAVLPEHDAGKSFEEVLVSWEDFRKAGLCGTPSAKVMRMRLGEKLKIGYGNGQQMYKKLHLFQIARREFEQAMAQIYQEEGATGQMQS